MDHHRIPIVKSLIPSKRTIKLIYGEAQAVAFSIDPVQQKAAACANQAYRWTVTPGSIVFYADAPAGLFYAAQTVPTLETLKELVIVSSQ
jgi:hypothetical protein